MQKQQWPFAQHQEDGVHQFEHFADNEQPNPVAVLAQCVVMHFAVGA